MNLEWAHPFSHVIRTDVLQPSVALLISHFKISVYQLVSVYHYSNRPWMTFDPDFSAFNARINFRCSGQQLEARKNMPKSKTKQLWSMPNYSFVLMPRVSQIIILLKQIPLIPNSVLTFVLLRMKINPSALLVFCLHIIYQWSKLYRPYVEPLAS